MVMELWLLWVGATGVWDRNDNVLHYLGNLPATVFRKTYRRGQGGNKKLFSYFVTVSLPLPSIQASRKILDISLSSSPMYPPA